MKQRPNYLAGIAALGWLVIIGMPIYVMLGAAFQSQEDFSGKGPLGLPGHLTFDNFVAAFETGFGAYFMHTLVVTVAVVAIVLVLVPPLAFTIVRNIGRRSTRRVFRLFLVGLAIPVQAVIVPMFYVMNELGLYDNLIGVILPTAAFALPVCVLILTGTMREISSELFEAMTVDGASASRVFFQLVLPLSWGGISTIVVFSALQAWNGFLFPLVLTQSQDSTVITLGLFNFRTQSGTTNVPGLLAAVLLSILPILLVYLFARRALIRGLMGVGGK